MLNREVPPPEQPRRGDIIIDYSGTLAQRLVWNTQRLEDIGTQLDLRSTIVIDSDHRLLPQARNTEQLGQVMAMKSLTLFSRDSDPAQHIPSERDMNLDFSSGRARITLYDQAISQRIRREQNGKFNEQKYTEALNSHVCAGVRDVLLAEKQMRALMAMWKNGTTIAGTVGPLSLYVPGYYFSQAEPVLGGIYTVLISGVIFTMSASTYLYTNQVVNKLVRKDSPYFQSRRDIQVMGNTGKMIQSIYELGIKKPTLVTISPDKNTR